MRKPEKDERLNNRENRQREKKGCCGK